MRVRRFAARCLRALADRLGYSEPPCMWHGRPYLAARWEFDGRVHVLHEVSLDLDGKVTLRYMGEEEFVRANHVDPEAQLRRRRLRR